MTKLLILAIFALIVFSLGSAFVHMVRGRGQPRQMARALTIRIALSLFLFGLLFVLYLLGYIEPHGLVRSAP